MRAISLTAGCKVNLFLRVTGRRADGCHTLDSLFLPLPEPCDFLHISPGDAPGLRVLCSNPAVDPDDNTLTKAYARYAEAASFAPPLIVKLEKGIPAGAGLGGGSSDAARLLERLNNTAPRPLAAEKLRETALRVGADVPFFLQNTPCRVRGIGEILTPAPAPQEFTLVLLCPEISVSTAWAYAALDTLRANDITMRNASAEPADNKKREATDAESSFFSFTPVNELEAAVLPAYPELGRLKVELVRQGAATALMSGSGSSVFGLFRERETALRAADFFRKDGLRVWAH